MCKFCLVFFISAYATLAFAQGTIVPLQDITDVVKNMETTLLFNRSCTTSTWTDNTGCLFISFSTEILSTDTTDSLCNGMRNYINTSNWLTGASASCTVNGTVLTLLLQGQSNPNYDPNAPPPPPPGPLQILSKVIANYPNPNLGGCICQSFVSKNSCGKNTINLICDLNSVSPRLPSDVVCKNVLGYLDQNHWLSNSCTQCVAISKKSLLINLSVCT